MRTYEQILADATVQPPFSNGTSGEIWMDRWCYRCLNDSPELVDRGEGCPLILAALTGHTPVEWRETGLQDYECLDFEERREYPGSVSDPEPMPPVADVEFPGQRTIFEVFTEQVAETLNQDSRTDRVFTVHSGHQTRGGA